MVLIGRVDVADRPERARCLNLANVHAVGWRAQAEIAAYNQAFDVCLIPYHVANPFNAACCPTKIMDTMGSGRPMVSTAVPECRLSAHLFDVAESHDAFIEAILSILERGSDDGQAEVRWRWAKANTCEAVVRKLLGAIPKWS